jgi:hypothetical protein
MYIGFGPKRIGFKFVTRGVKMTGTKKRLKIIASFTVLAYLFLGLNLFLTFTSPSINFAAVSAVANDSVNQDMICLEQKTTDDEKLKSAVLDDNERYQSQFDSKGFLFAHFCFIFLKQIAALQFSLRSPPIFVS